MKLSCMSSKYKKTYFRLVLQKLTFNKFKSSFFKLWDHQNLKAYDFLHFKNFVKLSKTDYDQINR